MHAVQCLLIIRTDVLWIRIILNFFAKFFFKFFYTFTFTWLCSKYLLFFFLQFCNHSIFLVIILSTVPIEVADDTEPCFHLVILFFPRYTSGFILPVYTIHMFIFHTYICRNICKEGRSILLYYGFQTINCIRIFFVPFYVY